MAFLEIEPCGLLHGASNNWATATLKVADGTQFKNLCCEVCPVSFSRVSTQFSGLDINCTFRSCARNIYSSCAQLSCRLKIIVPCHIFQSVTSYPTAFESNDYRRVRFPHIHLILYFGVSHWMLITRRLFAFGHHSINQSALGPRHQSAPCLTPSHINTNISAFSSILSDVLHLTPNDAPALHLFIKGATNSEQGELSQCCKLPFDDPLYARVISRCHLVISLRI